MATLHNEYLNFERKIKLSGSKKEKLRTNRKGLRERVKKWFSDNKPDELPPKFSAQGSFMMHTITNPIPEKNENGKELLKYDLDDGIYFEEKAGEDNKRSIDTWHNWVYQAVDGYTTAPPERKTTCIRVFFSDGHHIDLPIYYKKDTKPELADKSKGWHASDPREFYRWFNRKTKDQPQLRRIVRYLKAWKNFKENNNTQLKLASGFALTILAVENYHPKENEDEAFRLTVEAMYNTLQESFQCRRPTTPKYEDVFANYSSSKKENFLSALKSLKNDCKRAEEEKNIRKATEILRDNQFGNRFPLGKDESEKEKTESLGSLIAGSGITQRPYYGR